MVSWRIHKRDFKFSLTKPVSYSIIILLSISTICSAQGLIELRVKSEYKLSGQLDEISGIYGTKNGFYAINDSGNEAAIYLLNKEDFSLVTKYKPAGLKNHDWEELTLFEDSLFIGDFGNNFGNRRDLAIYSIPVSGLNSQEQFTRRSFRYASQGDFGFIPHTHRWDCESMIVLKNEIVLLSKDWLKQESLVYRISRDKLHSDISAVDSIKLGFLVTGAFFEKRSSFIYLCGYYNKSTFIARIDGDGEFNLDGRITRYLVPELKNRQVESIFVDDGLIYIASEATQKSQKIYTIEIPPRDE